MPRISTVLADWLAVKAPSLSPRSIGCYRDIVRLHIDPAIGRIKAKRLRPADVSAMLAGLCGAGRGRTAELAYIVCRQALPPAVMAAVPRPRHRAAPAEWWDTATLSRYLAHSQSLMWRCAWLLAAVCGLRRGELAGLQWCDIDYDARLIRVRRQRQAVPGRGIVTAPPKSASGVRDIPLPNQLAAELAALQAGQQAAAMLGGMPPPPWVLPGRSPDGGVSPYAIDAAHRAQCARAGVRPIPLHGLRHTMAAAAIASGTSARVLQTLLGHASITTTAHIYAHVSGAAQRSAIDHIAQMCYTDCAMPAGCLCNLTLNQGVQGSSP